MSNPFSQIDPSSVPQGRPQGVVPQNGQAAGKSTSDGGGGFEALLSEKTSSTPEGELADSVVKDLQSEVSAKFAVLPDVKSVAGEEDTLAHATALVGLSVGQAPPPGFDPGGGKAGLKVEAPTLPPAPGGGPLADADIDDDATSGKKILTSQTTKPGALAGGSQHTDAHPGRQAGAAPPEPAKVSSTGAGPATGPATSQISGQAAGAPTLALALEHPSPTSGTSNTTVIAATDQDQTQAPGAATVGQVNEALAQTKSGRPADETAATRRKTQATEKPRQADTGTNPKRGVGVSSPAGETARGANDGPIGNTAVPEAGTAPGQAPSHSANGPVLRVAAPLTPGGPPNLPVRSIAVHMAQQSDAGVRQFNISLVPASLGRIKVEMEIHKDGRVTANLTVDRPETLDALQRDARALERALQNAGLKPEQGALNFSLRDQSGGRETADTNLGQHDQEHQETHLETEPIAQRSISLAVLDISV